MNSKKYIFLLILIIPAYVSGQMRMTLDNAIKTATDSSLSAFKAQNLYLSSYWEYKSFVAQNKPFLTLNANLLDYNRALVRVYNSELNINEYTEQRDIYSYANAAVTQKLPFSGGTLYFDSELSRLQNFGENNDTRFSSVPLRIGLNQPVLGFNSLKWEKKIEPLKYEKAKKKYLQSVETISIAAVDYFFDLLVARTKVSMAVTNVANTDTLLNIGQKRLEIAALTLADVLALKVDALNARNDLAEARKQLAIAQYVFNSFLRLSEEEAVDLAVPDDILISVVNYDEAMQMALSDNPELLDYRQQLLESESDFEKARRENRFSASFNASFGLNQQNEALPEAYRNLMDQQRAAFTFAIPIIDWGQGRGKINMAKNNYEVKRLTVEQAFIDFRQRVIMAVTDFNMQLDIIKSAGETRAAAAEAYAMTKQRFMIGKADVYSLGLALSRQDEATLNYLEALRSYWKYYYNLRQLTLYDFVNGKALARDFDEKLGMN
jgi:outer membrane protein TolC